MSGETAMVSVAVYKFAVTTGDMPDAGTWDDIFVTIYGSQGRSKRTKLTSFGTNFSQRQVGTYTVSCSMSLGSLLLLKVEKERFLLFPDYEWYCSKIKVTTPEEEVFVFPCYRWISRGESVELRAGKATKMFEDCCQILTDHREKELLHKKKQYQFKVLHERITGLNHVNERSKLPAEIRLPKKRRNQIKYNNFIVAFEFTLRRLYGSFETWKTFEAVKNLFWRKHTPMSDYVTQHWQEDDFYGYQFLNGINPNVIKLCTKLPVNFPVTNDMVRSFLANDTSLQEAIMNGKIFLCDYKKMEGLATRSLNGTRVFVASGFCLFYVNPQHKLLPIAIQLEQKPSEENPIFLPSDSESDWLLAKMFIKNADFLLHQTVHHFLHTHFLGEVYSVSTYRNLPSVHPVYKLLIQHLRSAVHRGACVSLLGQKGIFKTCSLTEEGVMELIKRSLSELTYSALCLPDNITARGLDTIPNFYYRDDGQKLWNTMQSFVRAMLEHYYPSDEDVMKDLELQQWVNEIFKQGFKENKNSDFPECFLEVDEVVMFVTMILFSVTAQHAAFNNGQFDYYYWLPNGSAILSIPPPTVKGLTSMSTVLEALPNVGDAASLVRAGWVMSQKYKDMIPLGNYPEEHFVETFPKQIMKDFQIELVHLSDAIAWRNSKLEVPYTYMDPAVIE
ncbi:hypothetical protein WMY93_016392 [Mugilogobius chulae]|uniref:Uncharacterized protein n=1 Tax=Mugilogobius chulae TaxID=88201 RepID=A0AAW0NZZ6_9GOBI